MRRRGHRRVPEPTGCQPDPWRFIADARPAIFASLACVLLRPAFTAPTFDTFCALLAGFIGRVGEHTITGMWQAARLADRVHHSRAHDFFARAGWCADRLGLLVLDFLIERFLDPETPITLAVDGSVFARSGRKVFGAVWHHDSGAAPNGNGFKFGNCFVVVGLVVRIGALGERAWCLPVLFRLWRPTPKPTKRNPDPKRRPSQPELAARLIERIAKRYPKRRLDVVGDAAFGTRALASLPERVSVTARLRSNAAIYAPKPPPTGRRGRPRKKGQRLGTPGELAAAGEWIEVEVPGRGAVAVCGVRGLWYSVFGPREVEVILVRECDDGDGYRIALVTTDLDAAPEQIIARYDERWSIECSFQGAKHVVGVGEARNRTRRAVERTVPFGFLCQTLVVAWYVLHGDPRADVVLRRRSAPWYVQERDPSMLDMLTALRRELIRAEFQAQAGASPKAAKITRPALRLQRVAA